MDQGNTSRVKRLRNGGDGTLLDEKRLRAIRRRIAGDYYNRREVRRSIVERLASLLIDDSDADER